jgi:hypothetical protein
MRPLLENHCNSGILVVERTAKYTGGPERASRAVTIGNTMDYKEHFVQRARHGIYVREYAGEEPVIILAHGFPDNLHLYDCLVSGLSPARCAVAVDLKKNCPYGKIPFTGSCKFRGNRK